MHAFLTVLHGGALWLRTEKGATRGRIPRDMCSHRGHRRHSPLPLKLTKTKITLSLTSLGSQDFDGCHSLPLVEGLP